MRPPCLFLLENGSSVSVLVAVRPRQALRQAPGGACSDDRSDTTSSCKGCIPPDDRRPGVAAAATAPSADTRPDQKWSRLDNAAPRPDAPARCRCSQKGPIC